MNQLISTDAISRRREWVAQIQSISAKFDDASNELAKKLGEEINRLGHQALLDHLRLCGDIPEQYGHDSTEEKQYSKYTDALLNETFSSIGLKSWVLSERGDAADVEVVSEDFSFVADAKAFRLSRTAKNQKDFKVSAMNTWKRGKPFAIVVCPVYQLPERSSQIYQQATALDVCILSYSHLAVIAEAARVGCNSIRLLHEILKSVKAENPSKDSRDYWYSVNKTMLNFHPAVPDLWKAEKQASLEALKVAKDIALDYLASEREKIMRLSHREALSELLRINRIESRITTIKGVDCGRILEF